MDGGGQGCRHQENGSNSVSHGTPTLQMEAPRVNWTLVSPPWPPQTQKNESVRWMNQDVATLPMA